MDKGDAGQNGWQGSGGGAAEVRIVSQTLSLIGMLAIAVVIAVVARGIGAGGVPWLRVVAVLALAGLCFWAAGRVRRADDGDADG
ncbi:hypothetical protein [Palleronia rufa]|uniref:hypothetical protein n=1 Tax=Palleronia rufa TaxID=1530186 RepID=UPI00055DEE3C|nr:hypothetical protein [Palleronia rufa]